MKDRIPTKPGRVQLVPSPDDDDLFILTRADEPTQAGTPLNKASLLSDATAAGFELDTDAATVDGALSLVAGQYTRVRVGTSAPGPDTTAKRGDLYVMDAGGDRHVYLCDAVGERIVDLGAVWERGTLDANGASSAADYRVRSDMVRISAGTKFSIASGYHYLVRLFNDNREYSSTVSFRSIAHTFEADTYARITIRKNPEDTSITADVDEFSSALTATLAGSHWTPLAGAREVRKTVVFTSSGYFTVPGDLRGTLTVQCFGGGSGGQAGTAGFGGGGGRMATWTGVPTQKKYAVTVGRGGSAGFGGEASSFGDLCTAQGGGVSVYSGGAGPDGGSGGGGGNASNGGPGNGSYGGGGGGYNTAGGNGGTYGGGGGGGTGGNGGTAKSGAFTGGTGNSSYGGGGAGWTANGKNATSSTGGNGGAGQNTTGFGLDFEGTGAAGTLSGGGGGYGGSGGNGLETGSLSTGGGGGGYGADGGSAGTESGGGGGGYGGPGGAGYLDAGGGGGGYGLSGRGGSRSTGYPAGIAAGGAPGMAGGGGVVVIYYTGIEVV